MMDIKNQQAAYQNYSEELHHLIMEIFTAWVVYIHIELIINLKNMKDYVITMIILWNSNAYEDINTLKYSHGENSLKVANIFYLDLESLLIKRQSSQNNPKESYTEKKLFTKLVATH